MIEDLPIFDLTTGADRVGRRQIEPAGEDREPAEHRLFRRLEQVVGPVNGGVEGALAGQRRLGRSGENPKRIVETIGQIGRRHAPQPGGGEFQSERNPVDARADAPDIDQFLIVRIEVGSNHPSSIQEQQRRLRLPQLVRRIRQTQRWDP